MIGGIGYYVSREFNSDWDDLGNGEFMKWEGAPPTSAGWYWVKLRSEKSTRVYYFDGRAWRNFPSDPAPYPDEWIIREFSHWLGPIPEPGEAVESVA